MLQAQLYKVRKFKQITHEEAAQVLKWFIAFLRSTKQFMSIIIRVIDTI